MAYRFYISEALKILTYNSAVGVNGNYINKSFNEILKPQKVEERTPEEIIDHIKKGLSEK